MRDMTQGKPLNHLWRYALPLLLGNWLQLAYNAVDSMIAGRFIGQNALAAEGIASPIMNLVILAISGMCIGAGIKMSEYFGGKDFGKLKAALSTTVLFGLLLSLAISLLGILLTPAILSFLHVPEEIFDITTSYLRIIFLGTPFTFAYNSLAAGLKSVGDSKTPLKFLAFSSILNAVLDLIFLGIFRFGIICSAITTVVAEAASALLAFFYMRKHQQELCPGRGEWRIDRELLGGILQYGGPTALQQAIQPVGKLLIQGQVNLLGVSTIAAFNAVTRVDDFACIPEQGISSAVSTYIAQNRGAKRFDRVVPGFRAGICLEVCYWALIGTVAYCFRTPFVSLFVTGQGAEEVVTIGAGYLAWMALFYLWPAMTNVFQGFFRGMGKNYTTILGTTIQISMRTIFTYILAPGLDLKGIAFASVIGWSLMLLFEIPYYFHTCKKKGLRGRADPESSEKKN